MRLRVPLKFYLPFLIVMMASCGGNLNISTQGSPEALESDLDAESIESSSMDTEKEGLQSEVESYVLDYLKSLGDISIDDIHMLIKKDVYHKEKIIVHIEVYHKVFVLVLKHGKDGVFRGDLKDGYRGKKICEKHRQDKSEGVFDELRDPDDITQDIADKTLDITEDEVLYGLHDKRVKKKKYGKKAYKKHCHHKRAEEVEKLPSLGDLKDLKDLIVEDVLEALNDMDSEEVVEEGSDVDDAAELEGDEVEIDGVEVDEGDVFTEVEDVVSEEKIIAEEEF